MPKTLAHIFAAPLPLAFPPELDTHGGLVWVVWDLGGVLFLEYLPLPYQGWTVLVVTLVQWDDLLTILFLALTL